MIRIFLIAMLVCVNAFGADVSRTIPDRAHAYLPVFQSEADKYFPDIPFMEYLPALAEHESGCFSMPRKCMNPASTLDTDREFACGLGQITKVYGRFDKLQELRDRYPSLRQWTWQNCASRPDFQIRAMALMLEDHYSELYAIPDKAQALKMVDAGYNGGVGGVRKERTACGLTRGCNPNRWDGNVELHCLKSKKPLYGNRSACDINRHHVRDVWLRMPKYRRLMQ